MNVTEVPASEIKGAGPKAVREILKETKGAITNKALIDKAKERSGKLVNNDTIVAARNELGLPLAKKPAAAKAGTKKKEVCQVRGCKRDVLAKAFCGMHYHQWRSGKLTATGAPRSVAGSIGGALNSARRNKVAQGESTGLLKVELSVSPRAAVALLSKVQAGGSLTAFIAQLIEDWAESV